MARRRQQRILAIDIATVQGCDAKRMDWERFVNTGEAANTVVSEKRLPPSVMYEIERIRRNGGHYVAPEDQVKFDAERN